MLKKQEIKFKSFLKMQERLDEIRKELSNLPSVPLKVPYQDGWLIKYDLRDDIKRRKDVHEIRSVLKLGFAPYRHTNKIDEVKDIRRGLKFGIRTKQKKKIRIDYAPERRMITEVQYECLLPRIKYYFYLDTTCDAYRLYGRKYYYAILPQYWLILKAKPYFVTHTRKKGGPLEQEYSYLSNKLDEYWREWCGHRTSWDKHERKAINRGERNQIRTKIQSYLKGELEEIY